VARKIIRAGIVAVLAGSALAAAAPAHASQIRPGVVQGYEYVTTFYSNAQETTVVGTYAHGSCGNYATGVTSLYHTINVYQCPS
jgi:hypothetical protein